MRRFWILPAVLLLGLVACGPLPITVDLLPSLQEAGLAQDEFSFELDVPPGTDLSGQDFDLKLPDDDGMAFDVEPPTMPATPASMVLDFSALFDYQLDCVEGLGGYMTVGAYLAPDEDALWESPLAGTEKRVELRDSDSLELSGRASLTSEQMDAVLSGHAVLGVRVVSDELEGKSSTNPSCKVTLSGDYQIQKAVLEVRFF